MIAFLQSTVIAQLEQSKRLEFKQNSMENDENQVFPLGEDGLFLINSKTNYVNRTFTLNISKYDTTFTEKWHFEYIPDDQFELVRTYQNQNFIYLFFRKEATTKINILRIDCETGEKAITEGSLPVNMDIDFISVLKNKAFIGGKYNDRPVVVAFSLFDKSVKVFPEIHANYLIINELEIDEISDQVILMVKNERTCQFILKIYDYDGKLVSSEVVGDRNHNPISGKILNFNQNKNYLIGNFTEACSLLSQGFYLHNLAQNKTTFVPFSILKNFFKYLKPKREQKIVAKMNIKRQQGRDSKLWYRSLLHNIIPYQDGFLLLAEIFYPEFKSPSNTIFNSMRAYHLGNDVYNSFRYSHAIICFFDRNGELMWDNCFSLDNLESSELNEKTQLTFSGELCILAYPKDGIIKTEVIKTDQTVNPAEKFQLKLDSETENLTDSEKTNLSAWYDRNFLVYGYQTIKNNSNPNNSRKVFYINKLNYVPK